MITEAHILITESNTLSMEANTLNSEYHTVISESNTFCPVFHIYVSDAHTVSWFMKAIDRTENGWGLLLLEEQRECVC